MSQRLVLATRNQGKIIELRRILDSISHGTIELVSVDQYPNIADVEETGSTFEENALLKAEAICNATGLPAIADDSGLCIDALGGAPGIFSARYAGSFMALSPMQQWENMVLVMTQYSYRRAPVLLPLR